MSSPRLLTLLRDRAAVRRFSPRTVQAYARWVVGYVRFHGKRHPGELPTTAVRDYLTHLAVDRRVAASTQNQALAALRFLYGSGLRLMECCQLRVKDVDLDRLEVRVRHGTGARDRVTMLPQSLVTP